MPLELRMLIHRSFDDSLGEAEFEELQAALKSNSDARLHYGDVVRFHADLVATKQAAALCRDVQHEYQTLPLQPRPRSFRDWLPVKQWHRITDAVRHIPPRAAASLLAAGLGLGCGVGIMAAAWVAGPQQFLPVPWNWSVGSDVVARIASTDAVDWQAMENPETLPTRGLRIGEMLRIEQGLLQIAYRNGVSVILRGPAVYEVRSENGGKLFAGKLSTIVPSDNPNFLLETSLGKFQLGPGHFGIAAENSAAARQVTFMGFSGGARGGSVAQFESTFGTTSSFATGDAIQFNDMGLVTHVAMPDTKEFPNSMPASSRPPFDGDRIYLGNLFDDSTTASLDEAMKTDRYNAAAETIDLGVASVHNGGLDVDVSLAEDGVLFNFLNVGGGGAKVGGLPGNDTHRSISIALPIRTTGELLGHDISEGSLPKVEEGIGIDSNKLLTFDLQELRDAGKLDGKFMRFVADRAGMNDREYPLDGSLEKAHANMIVIVSTEDKVLSANLNGEGVPVTQHANVFSLEVDEAKATNGMRYSTDFVKFDVAIPPEARFLTLVSTQLESEHYDHTVFSGARLEIEPAQESPAGAK
ncbi:hypothetical protein [Aeoliella sp. SH292]|uniref:hypothetical protein n=1 Tax=Aeoliella sp. SH292 TaxID=3454464 RepID=UPI003F95E74B